MPIHDVVRKKLCLALIIIPLGGCALGRSWDSLPNMGDHAAYCPFADGVIYVDGEVPLVERSIRRGFPENGLNGVVLRAARRDVPQQYPYLSVIVEPAEWSTNVFYELSYMISGATLSLIPGYSEKISRVTMSFTDRNESGQVFTRRNTFDFRRHYISWLPLILVRNFVQTVQVWSEPDFNWTKGYENMVIGFLRERCGEAPPQGKGARLN